MTNYAENREIMRVITQTAATANGYLTTDTTGMGSVIAPGNNRLMRTTSTGVPGGMGLGNNGVLYSNGIGIFIAAGLSEGNFFGRRSGVEPGALTPTHARTILDIVSVRKPSNESRTVNTILDDSDLVVTVAANTNYEVHATIFFDSHTTPDFKYAWTIPSGTIDLAIDWRKHASVEDASWVYDTSGTQFGGATTTTGTKYFLQVSGSIEIAGTGGTFAFRWAQNNTDAGNATTVHEGSILRVSAI